MEVANAKLEAALSYAARGWPVFPCHSIRDGRCSCSKSIRVVCAEDRPSPGKHPRCTHGLLDATKDPQQIKDWWTSWPDANIGIATGAAAGLFVVDVDPRHGGDATLSDLESKHGKVPDTVEALTGGGGRHLYFAHPGGNVRSKNGVAPGIDIKCDGGYVLAAPSNHIEGRTYEWESSSDPAETPLAPAPKWALDLLAAVSTSAGAPAPSIEPEIAEGKRDDTLTSLGGSMRRRGMTFEEISTALKAVNARRCKPPLPDASVDRIAASVARYKPVEPRQEPPPHTDKEAPPSWAAAESPDKPDDPRAGPEVVRGTRYAATVAAVLSPRFQSAVCEGAALEWNAMAGRPECGRVPLEDHVVNRIRQRMPQYIHIVTGINKKTGEEEVSPFEPKPEDLWAAVDQVAHARPFHPVREQLEALHWDGCERISGFSKLVLGVPDAKPVSQAMLRRWFIGSVARAFQPGCKFDCVLVLVGPQGAKKTTTFEKLAMRPEFYLPFDGDITTRDSLQQLASAWIVELAELESLRGREISTFKAFSSRRYDSWVGKWQRSPTRVPRSFVLAGSTNEETFLEDPSGNRRFWTVRTSDRIRLDVLEAWAQQLWAEAVELYRKGERWWLGDAEDKELGEIQGQFERRDVWEHQIHEWVKAVESGTATGPLTAHAALEQAINKPLERCSKADEMRIASIFRRLGYRRKHKMVNGAQEWVWERREQGEQQVSNLNPV